MLLSFYYGDKILNGTNKGKDKRPFTDYSLENCTNDNCDRRRQYLLVASELLVKDLQDIKNAWKEGGIARNDLVNTSEKKAITRILTGMGSLSYGELAGERMKLGLMLNDPEEEHDCFSDNTHNSHYFNVIGIQNIYLGKYTSLNNKIIRGASLSDMVAAKNIKLDAKLKESLENTVSKMNKIVSSAENGITYDMLIGKNNKSGNLLIQNAVDALVNQSKDIEEVAKLLEINDLKVEGSDSLDNPEAVFY